MKKIIIIVVVVLVLTGGAILLTGNGKKDSNSPNTSSNLESSSKEFSPPEACSLFTLEDAKKVLGETAEKPETSSPQSSSDDVAVSQCLYQQPAGADIASIRNQKQASVLVRGAKTPVGSDSNKAAFADQLPMAAERVDGYGDAAFWNPEFGQLNILKDGNWYIIQVGATSLDSRTIDEAKKLADVLTSKL